jgi:hypothetical protein
MKPSRSILVVPLVIFVAAVLVRLVYWLMAPPAHASDTAEFLRAARSMSVGDWGGLRDYPFHAAYAFLLAPAFWFGTNIRLYVASLHIFLSAGSVVLLWAVTRRIVDDALAAVLAAAIGVVYPNLLFWMPYILTETAFVFFLLVFAYAVLAALDDRSPSSRLRMVALGAFLFFLRPVAVAVVACGLAVAGFDFLRQTISSRAAMSLVISAGATIVAATAVICLMKPGACERILRVPTIGQTLWLSTTVVHGTQAELTRAATPDIARDWPVSEQYAYKAHLAAQFIRDHPVRYIEMAAKRFVSFWAPWRYLDWSARHRAMDAMLSLGLIAMACSATMVTGRTRSLVLLGFAVVLSLESAFGQIDADARYRLPAEALLIPPAAIALSAAIGRARSRRSFAVQASA